MTHTFEERPSVLDNPRSERIRQVAALSGRSFRKKSGRILVEGPQAVRELIRFRPETLVDVYFTPAASTRHADVFDEATRETRWVHLMSDQVGDKISRDSQGVVAVATDRAVSVPADQASRVFARAATNGSKEQGASFSVLLPQVQDPGNVGTIIRTADAMGAKAVFLGQESADPSNPKVIRASAGSVFHLPLVQGDFTDVVAQMRGLGAEIVGTALGERQEDLNEWVDLGSAGPLGAPHMWVFGNEARGLSEDEKSACDRLVHIQMAGGAESLNASAAAAICLHASSFVNR